MKLLEFNTSIEFFQFWKLSIRFSAGLVGFKASAGSWYNHYGDGFFVDLGLGIVRLDITVQTNK